ncbi:MAG: RdgB/HAM1 family non-canonical purine NTP pyrophosphatase [Pseudomonadota bacterium]
MTEGSVDSDRQELVLATGNTGKLREFSRLLADLPFELRMQSELAVVAPEETGITFVENALIKARAAAEQTGLPALADDSGISVDALGGSPGVRSARYAGTGRDEDNNSKLLEALAQVPTGQRRAHFHCALVYLRHAQDPCPLIAQGRWYGEILEAPRGLEGFGYDPLFFVPTHGVAAAELERDVKNRISHRAIAVQKLLAQFDER